MGTTYNNVYYTLYIYMYIYIIWICIEEHHDMCDIGYHSINSYYVSVKMIIDQLIAKLSFRNQIIIVFGFQSHFFSLP
jgi:hypothetical protein